MSLVSSSSLGTLDLLLLRPGELGTSPGSSSPVPGPLKDPPRPRLVVLGVLRGVPPTVISSSLSLLTAEAVLFWESWLSRLFLNFLITIGEYCCCKYKL